MARRNKEKVKEAIIDYIKQQTKNGTAIPVRSIDISNMFKIPQSSCIRLLREVRQDKRIKAEAIFPGKKKSSPCTFIHIDNVKIVSQEKLENKTIERENNPTNVLCDNLSKFSQHISNFQNFIAETADFIKNGESSKNLKENLEQSKDVIEKFLSENIELQNKISKLNQEKQDLNNFIKALKDCNDNVVSYMQQRLQIVIVEITNQSKEYVNTPKWQINNAFDAKFEKQILDIITTAIDDIIDNNTNIKAE